MIVWEVRDTDGALLTTCFNEQDAVKFRDRFEARHKRSGLKIAKVFDAQEREKEPVKLTRRAPKGQAATPGQMAAVNKAISHVRVPKELPEDVSDAQPSMQPQTQRIGPSTFFVDGINDVVSHIRTLMVELDPEWNNPEENKIKKIEIVKKYQYTGNKPDKGWVVMVR